MLPTKDSRFAALTFTFKILVAEIRTLFPSPDGALVSKVSNLNKLESKDLVNGIFSTGQLTDMQCPFCRITEEGASHLFFHCCKIQPIWWDTMSWLQIKGAFPFSPKQHFLHHFGVQLDGVRTKRWQYWWLALTWSIWKLRNNIAFSNATFNANSLFEDATFLLWSWLRSFEKDFTVHFNQWASSFTQSFMQQQRIT